MTDLSVINKINAMIDSISSIEERLSRIERQMNLSPPSSTHIAPVAKETKMATKTERTAAYESKPSNWLGITAVMCFVLAAAFIIKLSIDSGWLTPPRQIGIAAIFGFTLIGLGLRFLSIDRTYMSLLPATGIIILYLATFAANHLYALISNEMTVILFDAVSLLCIGLYLKIKHDVYPITAAIGTYIAPVVTLLATNSFFSIYYFVMCSFTFAILSIVIQSRILAIVSAYLAIFITGYFGDNFDQNNMIAGALASHFLIFSISTFLYTQIWNKPLTKLEAWSFFPALLLFYATEYHYLNLIQPGLAPKLSLGFAGFLLLLYLVANDLFARGSMASQSMIFSFVGIVLFHSGYVELLPSYAGPWLFAAIIVSIAFLPQRFIFASIDSASINFIPVVPTLIFIVLGIEYLTMMDKLYFYYPTISTSSWIACILSAASLWLLYFCKNKSFETNEVRYVVLTLANLLMMLILYAFSHPISSLAVSLSWLLYAIVVIATGFARKDKVIANSALFILAFAAGKVLLYDAAAAPTVIRILCLLFTGIALYGAGLLFRRIAKWQ
jgi:uncharacterized membrane protein